eukprot:4228428-Amphidinium_carterae.2
MTKSLELHTQECIETRRAHGLVFESKVSCRTRVRCSRLRMCPDIGKAMLAASITGRKGL